MDIATHTLCYHDWAEGIVVLHVDIKLYLLEMRVKAFIIVYRTFQQGSPKWEGHVRQAKLSSA